MPARTKERSAGAARISSSLLGGGGDGGFARRRTYLKSYACFSMQSQKLGLLRDALALKRWLMLTPSFC